MHKPVLVFDFDNTLTAGDVLDDIILQFSPNEDWRQWESEWSEGRLSARDCLRLQVENLRVTRSALMDYLAGIRVDSAFPEILEWAQMERVKTLIVSDSFLPLIRRILDCNGIGAVPVFANDLGFAGDRLQPGFPYHDPAFPRSANAKAKHLAGYTRNTIVFAGDGRSDLDAALAADVVFAKDTLARELSQRKVPYRAFTDLSPVLDYVHALSRKTA